jgi:dihydrofolate reductase
MGKLVVTEFITLDGVIEDPGESGWAFRFDRGEEGNRFKFEELMAADVQLLGRRTYEGFAKAWPERSGDEFSRKFNEMPKVVVSTTLTDPEWQNTTVLSGDLASGVHDLKERYTGDVLVSGSGRLVQSLLALDLVDELRLMIFPTVLGAGKRLFAEGQGPKDFSLVETRQAGECVILTFRRDDERRTG